MLKSNTMAREVAGFLLQINAIKLNTENPFTWLRIACAHILR